MPAPDRKALSGCLTQIDCTMILFLLLQFSCQYVCYTLTLMCVILCFSVFLCERRSKGGLVAILLPAGGLLRNKDVRLRAGLRGVIGRLGVGPRGREATSSRSFWSRSPMFARQLSVQAPLPGLSIPTRDRPSASAPRSLAERGAA